MIVRRLWSGEKPSVQSLYLSLNQEDRRLRFFSPMTDDVIKKYVATLDFMQVTVLGAFNAQAKLLGVVELAPGKNALELSIVVESASRGQGVGSALAKRAWEEARTQNRQHLIISSLSENTAMRSLAERLGIWLRLIDGGDVEGQKELELATPRETLRTIAKEFASTALWSTAKAASVAREWGEKNTDLMMDKTDNSNNNQEDK